MADRLSHRGPDDEGSFNDGPVALAHRRLSIIDLSEAGRQPMENEDGSIRIAYNGEIYDHSVARRDLAAKGHIFRSGTDTEVLVHLYEEDPEGFLKSLNGMFALALWDSPRERLVLARDRMGKKPLYYAEFPGGLAFASEVDALLEHPDISREIDRRALHHYLVLGYIPAPLSIYRSIGKLLPGTTAFFERSGLRTTRFFVPSPDDGPPSSSFQDTVDELEEILTGAVARRLVADVPLGIFLSGGIDSSILAALAAARGRIKTFSIRFTDSEFDEGRYARMVAEKIGSVHTEETVAPGDILDEIPNVLHAFGEPFADASAIPTLVLSRMTRRHVTVALAGDGADELFAGYPTARAQAWADMVEILPFGDSLASFSAGLLPRFRYGYYPLSYVARRFAGGLGGGAAERQIRWTAYLSPEDARSITGAPKETSDDLSEYLDGTVRDLAGLPNEIISLGLDQRLYLPDDILVKTDRTTMSVSLEGRAPFLDPEVVAFASRLPRTFRRWGGRSKRPLRALARRLVGPVIAGRRKQGFAVPVSRWLREDLGGPCRDMIMHLRELDLDPEMGLRFLEEHLAGKRDRWRELWSLFVLGRWHTEKVLLR